MEKSISISAQRVEIQDSCSLNPRGERDSAGDRFPLLKASCCARLPRVVPTQFNADVSTLCSVKNESFSGVCSGLKMCIIQAAGSLCEICNCRKSFIF